MPIPRISACNARSKTTAGMAHAADDAARQTTRAISNARLIRTKKSPAA
jgi:hypothetical protein